MLYILETSVSIFVPQWKMKTSQSLRYDQIRKKLRGKVKGFAKFGNERISQAASGAFAEAVKVTNHPRLGNTELVWNEYYLPDLPLWLGAQPRKQRFYSYMTFPCKLRKISSTIRLPYIQLTHDKCFWAQSSRAVEYTDCIFAER